MLLTLLSQQGGVAGVSADLSATLGPISVTSGADVTLPPITADVGVTLGALTVSSDADFIGQGADADLSATLGQLTLSSDVGFAAPGVTADLSATLGALTLSSVSGPTIVASAPVSLDLVFGTPALGGGISIIAPVSTITLNAMGAEVNTIPPQYLETPGARVVNKIVGRML